MAVGDIYYFTGQSIPLNVLICDGILVPSAKYPDLYAAIGTTYGGDETTFALPTKYGDRTLGHYYYIEVDE